MNCSLSRLSPSTVTRDLFYTVSLFVNQAIRARVADLRPGSIFDFPTGNSRTRGKSKNLIRRSTVRAVGPHAGPERERGQLGPEFLKVNRRSTPSSYNAQSSKSLPAPIYICFTLIRECFLSARDHDFPIQDNSCLASTRWPWGFMVRKWRTHSRNLLPSRC